MDTTATELKLSDYMLAGITLTWPLRYNFVSEDDPGLIRACPIGAACFARDREVALEMTDPDIASGLAWETFPELSHVIRWTPPVQGGAEIEIQLINLITTLNDFLKWRRDKTARYIKKLGY
jgi:hypothetical protein